jgi:hypothetical protein
MTQEFRLTVTEAQVKIIADALSKEPFGLVVELFHSLQFQIAQQQQQQQQQASMTPAAAPSES